MLGKLVSLFFLQFGGLHAALQHALFAAARYLRPCFAWRIIIEEAEISSLDVQRQHAMLPGNKKMFAGDFARFAPG
jgi:hypothetical protein